MSSTQQKLCARRQANCVIVPVPWSKAEALQSYFQSHGITSTACLDPSTREAHLELQSSAGADLVQSLLDQWPI